MTTAPRTRFAVGSLRYSNGSCGNGIGLWSVDPNGQFGLVHRSRSPSVIVDLRTGVEVELPRHKSGRGTLVAPRLLSEELLLYSIVQERNDYEMFVGLAIYTTEGLEQQFLECQLGRDFNVSVDGRFAFDGVFTVELVELIPPYSVRRVEPMPRRVIQSVAFDSATQRLLATGWGELVLSVVDDDGLGASQRKAFGSDDVRWSAIGGNAVVACRKDRAIVHYVGSGIENRRGADADIKHGGCKSAPAFPGWYAACGRIRSRTALV